MMNTNFAITMSPKGMVLSLLVINQHQNICIGSGRYPKFSCQFVKFKVMFFQPITLHYGSLPYQWIGSLDCFISLLCSLDCYIYDY